MADSSRLLGAGVLMIAALFLFLNPTPTLDLAKPIDNVDNYPYNNNWSENGTVTGQMTDNSGTLTLSASGSGTFISDKKNFSNSTISLDNVIVDTSLSDDNDNAEIRVFGLNEDGIAVESENIKLQEGKTQYGLNERIQSDNQYSGYQFELYLESSDNQQPSIESVTMAYDVRDPLTNSSFLDDLLAWIFAIFGILLAVSG